MLFKLSTSRFYVLVADKLGVYRIVKVSAKEEFIDDVTLESLNIRVDLKDLKEGLHVVPILVDQTEEMVKVVVEPAQVNVTISKTQ